jgi:hypothetical protein
VTSNVALILGDEPVPDVAAGRCGTIPTVDSSLIIVTPSTTPQYHTTVSETLALTYQLRQLYEVYSARIMLLLRSWVTDMRRIC